MLNNIIKVFIIINILFTSLISLVCNNRNINHCIKCGTGNYSDTCDQCEDKYFPLFKNMICLKCNDSNYGQIACEGNCVASKYHEYIMFYVKKMDVKKDIIIWVVYALNVNLVLIIV